MTRRLISSGSAFERVAGYSRRGRRGGARPAAAAVVCGLVDERMKIEIEVTARKGA